jgi:hypothetical protein
MNPSVELANKLVNVQEAVARVKFHTLFCIYVIIVRIKSGIRIYLGGVISFEPLKIYQIKKFTFPHYNNQYY